MSDDVSALSLSGEKRVIGVNIIIVFIQSFRNDEKQDFLLLLALTLGLLLWSPSRGLPGFQLGPLKKVDSLLLIFL